MKDALLEIGSEELPASFIAPGMRQLKSLAEESLKASELPYAAIDVFGTPRRLAVVIHGLADRSPDQKKVVSGPPAAIAKDAQGQWTAAALGFARKQGLKPSDLTIENDKLTAALHIKGVGARQLLGDLFPQWISKLEFPKSMVWEPTHFRYPRPIRWIAALYGSDLVSFSIAGVRSVRWTLGIGPWAPKKIPVVQAGKYALLLKNQCVLVDPAGRRNAIERFADQAVKRVHGKLHMSAPLLEQVANLVEHPVAILGNFDPAYLDLPKEVLITCLEHHQKYFPVEQAAGGELLPHFVGIRNGMSVNQEVVGEGYERVLAARLADARFFFNQDRKSPLASKVEALKGVMFQQKLGNLFDKKERVKRLIDNWADAVGLSADEKLQAIRAGELSKADLVTGMVGEFPELQGIIARLYATADGEHLTVAQACEQHYWPITLASPLPETHVSAIVALADKLDTLAGDFAVGLIPTGSADPYGLRRAAVGVLRILETFAWNIPLNKLTRDAVAQQNPSVLIDSSDTEKKLFEFMGQRWVAWMQERNLCQIDEAKAVYVNLIPQALKVVEAIKIFRTDPMFDDLTILVKRANQLLKKEAPQLSPRFGAGFFPAVGFDEAILIEESEKNLWGEVRSVYEAIMERMSKKHDVLGSMKELRRLKDPIDQFFKNVKVMVDDERIRDNRLKLLSNVTLTALCIADFSKLQNSAGTNG